MIPQIYCKSGSGQTVDLAKGGYPYVQFIVTLVDS